jgi:hypothetical protein
VLGIRPKTVVALMMADIVLAKQIIEDAVTTGTE